jgi:hypothetical protein
MSYSVNEAITDGERRHLFFMAVKEAYPDAYLSGHRWESPSLSLEDCDGFDLEVEKTPLGYDSVRARLYRRVGSGQVYMRMFTGGVHLEPLFHHMREQNPDLFGQLLAWVKENA